MGYPDGLRGEEIPLESRIIEVVDAFEAMTSERPYKRTFNLDETIEELRRCSGTQFDPNIVETMLSILVEELEETKKRETLLTSIHLSLKNFPRNSPGKYTQFASWREIHIEYTGQTSTTSGMSKVTTKLVL